MKVQVLVRIKSGVLDVQGKAVEHGLNNLGVSKVHGVRVGRLIEFELEEKDAKRGKEIVKELCDKLLANTLIETYEIRAAE